MQSPVYRTGSYLVLDFETTSLENGSPLVPENRLLLACGLDSNGQRFHAFGGELEQAALISRLGRYDFIVAHNAKFELGWLRRCGADLRKLVVFDTQIAQKVLASNRPWPLTLDAVAAHFHLGAKDHFVKTLIHSGVDPATISPKALQAYCAQDVTLTHSIFKCQLRALDDRQLAVLQTRCELTPVLADIEFYGLGVDKERIEQEHAARMRELATLAQELGEIAPGVLLTSPKQVGNFVYDVLKIPELVDSRGNPVRTAGGARSVAEETLAALTPATKEARKFLTLKLRHATASAALTKYLRKLDGAARSNGRVYARFNQTVTKTGRLSSSGLPPANIQFQNMDREYKKLFVPRPGCVYIEADASQLEFRVAVDISQDQEGLAAIRAHRDVHMDTARVIAGNKWDNMDAAARGKLRAENKHHTFKPMYSGQSGTPQERAYYKWFQQHYAGIYAMQMGWVGEAVRTGEIRLPWGRYYFKDAVPGKDGYVPGQAQMFNYPIQAFATADIIPLVVRGIWLDLAGMKSRLVNTVHDSVLVEAPLEEVESVKKILVDNFINKVYAIIKARYGYTFKVPLSVEVKVGDHWGEGSSETSERQL